MRVYLKLIKPGGCASVTHDKLNNMKNLTKELISSVVGILLAFSPIWVSFLISLI